MKFDSKTMAHGFGQICKIIFHWFCVSYNWNSVFFEMSYDFGQTLQGFGQTLHGFGQTLHGFGQISIPTPPKFIISQNEIVRFHSFFYCPKPCGIVYMI